ncbi:MAG: class I SAM-dependent methyltransferase [Chloroflexi bacterium]|nr:class I SAM-dependent methyltransferase [Chloroflexota bacterium]
MRDATALAWRRLRLPGGSVAIPSRADQPAGELDQELRLLMRALDRQPEAPLLEVAAWDAGLAIAAADAGWPDDGMLVPLNLGAAESCQAGAGAWPVLPPDELLPAEARFAVVRAPHWLGRAGVEWVVRAAARALPPGGLLALLGDRARGVESLRRRLPPIIGPIVDRAAGEHRRLYLYERQVEDPPPQQFAWTSTQRIAGRDVTLCQHPTLFSPTRVDPATALLAEYLPDKDGRWLDLGCGSGVLTVAAARSDRNLTALDWSYAAVETTRRTLAASGIEAEVLLADGAPPGEQPFDVILCYPPFHVGPRVHHGPAARLIRAARDCLAPDGELRVVLTSAQSPRDLLQPHFRDVSQVASAHGARVFSCRPPTAARGRGR